MPITHSRSAAGWTCALALLTGVVACGGNSNGGFPLDGGPDGTQGGGGGDGGGRLGTGSGTGGGLGGGSGSGSGGGFVNPCPSGESTTVSGTVYDPAGRNPIYNVEVYVPAVPLTALPKGVPTGTEACSCSALFPSAAYASASTKVDGTFELQNVPSGMQTLVLQIGKWRRVLSINIANKCGPNAITEKLTLPGTIAAGDTQNNMPDIAVSTGGADSLECLLLRMGVASSEYVAGTSSAGHVHIFSGGGGPSKPEGNPMPGAPASSTSLWANQGQLMPYDITLLSCEGGETYNANPQALEDYLNAGGRAFASHYHYAWFSGPNLPGGSGQTYQSALPADYGANGATLGTWTANGTSGGGGNGDIGATVVTTLNPGPGTFTKGQTLETWLGESPVSALGQGGVSATELSIYQPRYNVVVGATNPYSQPWFTSATGKAGQTMYFSFDTPLAGIPGDGGTKNYCGRAVFADMHVGGDTDVDNDTVNGGGGFGGGGGNPPPAGCDNTELSPQEKALEFMLFDLSSCVSLDSKPIPDAGQVSFQPPPK